MAEAFGDRRQRRRDDRLIDDRQEHRQHDRGEEREELAAASRNLVFGRDVSLNRVVHCGGQPESVR